MSVCLLTSLFSVGFEKVAEILIQNGADVNIVAKYNETALTYAAENGIRLFGIVTPPKIDLYLFL